MIKVLKQIDAGKNTLLILDAPVPEILFTGIIINGVEYSPVIAYDMDNAIGVNGIGNFEGKEIKFNRQSKQCGS